MQSYRTKLQKSSGMLISEFFTLPDYGEWTIYWQVNGEIYNHKQLREKLKSHQFRTGSDCEVIAHLVSTHW